MKKVVYIEVGTAKPKLALGSQYWVAAVDLEEQNSRSSSRPLFLFQEAPITWKSSVSPAPGMKSFFSLTQRMSERQSL